MLIPILVGLAGAALTYFILRKLRRKQEERSGAAQRTQPSHQPRPSPTPEEEPQVDERAVQRVSEILNGNKTLAQMLKERVGLPGHAPNNRATCERIAAQLQDVDLEVYSLAFKQDLLSFELSKQTTRDEVPYPTSDVESIPLSDAGELPLLYPDQLLLPKPEFARQFSMGELQRPQYFESTQKAKLLYILLDVSPSMNESLRTGTLRHVLARGVAANLLLSANEQGGKYFFREFGGVVGDLVEAVTAESAEQLARVLLNEHHSLSSTDIPGAIARACEDIRTRGGELAQAELLLISDGESNMNEGSLRVTLGNINLHVVILGDSSNEVLAHVAKTFKKLG
jgi:uncharacterized protein with von Willebrand factor type A (vWA) domain